MTFRLPANHGALGHNFRCSDCGRIDCQKDKSIDMYKDADDIIAATKFMKWAVEDCMRAERFSKKFIVP